MTDDSDPPEPTASEFASDVSVTLSETADVSGFDLRNLEALGIATFETEHRDGRDLVTAVDINVRHLASMTTEFSVVERQLGDRWDLGSWDPEIRVR